ncbi:MAG: hypothetical protein WDN31_22490 [Hyphomicrobium sp.]
MGSLSTRAGASSSSVFPFEPLPFFLAAYFFLLVLEVVDLLDLLLPPDLADFDKPSRIIMPVPIPMPMPRVCASAPKNVAVPNAKAMAISEVVANRHKDRGMAETVVM